MSSKGKGKQKAASRVVQVASYARTIDSPEDPGDAPIVERMTRKRLGKLSRERAQAWVEDSIKAIKNAAPAKDQESILKYMMATPPGATRPSDSSPATDAGDASSPKKKAKKKTPETPECVTPSQRDGAPGRAILAYSPWVWS